VAQKSGCVCSGHWAHKKEHYVVTRREKATSLDGKEVTSKYSEIKCMHCYRKWRSNAGYIAKLPDHVERTWGMLTDADVLKLVRAGRIEVDFEKGVIWKERRAGKTWMGYMIKLTARTNRGGERWESDRPRGDPYKFVVVVNNECRKEISVSRLVWMAYHDQLIPEGFDVDHFDRNKENNAIDNLRLLEATHNRSDNGDGEREWDEDDF